MVGVNIRVIHLTPTDKKLLGSAWGATVHRVIYSWPAALYRGLDPGLRSETREIVLFTKTAERMFLQKDDCELRDYCVELPLYCIAIRTRPVASADRPRALFWHPFHLTGMGDAKQQWGTTYYTLGRKGTIEGLRHPPADYLVPANRASPILHPLVVTIYLVDGSYYKKKKDPISEPCGTPTFSRSGRWYNLRIVPPLPTITKVYPMARRYSAPNHPLFASLSCLPTQELFPLAPPVRHDRASCQSASPAPTWAITARELSSSITQQEGLVVAADIVRQTFSVTILLLAVECLVFVWMPRQAF
ncbi:hypothetical protein J6590_061881 [Homalodisca vitripennis]|nr:hypothetical protein J6590_061881 [Homalodisca vitripennis]